MKPFNRPAAIIIIAGALALLVVWFSGISDKETIDIAKSFYQKTGVRVASEPWVDSYRLIELVTGRKEIVVGERKTLQPQGLRKYKDRRSGFLHPSAVEEGRS